jgi:hypothetical protein
MSDRECLVSDNGTADFPRGDRDVSFPGLSEYAAAGNVVANRVGRCCHFGFGHPILASIFRIAIYSAVIASFWADVHAAILLVFLVCADCFALITWDVVLAANRPLADYRRACFIPTCLRRSTLITTYGEEEDAHTIGDTMNLFMALVQERFRDATVPLPFTGFGSMEYVAYVHAVEAIAKAKLAGGQNLPAIMAVVNWDIVEQASAFLVTASIVESTVKPTQAIAKNARWILTRHLQKFRAACANPAIPLPDDVRDGLAASADAESGLALSLTPAGDTAPPAYVDVP